MAGASSGSGPNGATPSPFEIGVQNREGVLIVTVSGDFDLSASQEFGRVFAELGADDLREVQIDLRPVSFIDSSGLRMLVEAEQIARERAVALRIVRGGSAVERVLKVTGLDKVLPLVDAA
jgi:anti-sigma B factor antagonist